MIAVIQRVRSASVSVSNEEVSRIGRGILVFLCVEKGDTSDDAEYISRKLPLLRIFEDENGKMNLSIKDIGGEILIVSQFTLAADLSRGLRPGFEGAEKPEIAEKILDLVVKSIELSKVPVRQGRFRSHMVVNIENDGPATFILDSRQKRRSAK